VSRYGSKSQPSLDSIEARISRHYQKIAGPDATVPSIMLLQAPIFHGYAFALFLELRSPVDVQALSQALTGDHIVIPGADEDSPSNVSSAGQADVQLSLKLDPARPNAVWLWAAADNLRIAALTAVECAESMTATRPTGKIQ
jgi:aspartate-semialdehyde dehydrogenase